MRSLRLAPGVVLLAGIGLAAALWLWALSAAAPYLGMGLFLFLSASGLAHTRIGRELAYTVVHTVGVAGLNTSGRPGDDPFVGFANFPFLLLAITAALIALGGFLVTLAALPYDRARTWRRYVRGVVSAACLLVAALGFVWLSNGDIGAGILLMVVGALGLLPVALALYFPACDRTRPSGPMRWRLRTLMLGIAAVACLAALPPFLHRRAESFRRLAAYHSRASAYLYEEVGPLPDGLTTVETFPVVASRGAAASRAFEAAMYHDLMEHKYLRAAEHPMGWNGPARRCRMQSRGRSAEMVRTVTRFSAQWALGDINICVYLDQVSVPTSI